jgi:hypothetical protein
MAPTKAVSNNLQVPNAASDVKQVLKPSPSKLKHRPSVLDINFIGRRSSVDAIQSPSSPSSTTVLPTSPRLNSRSASQSSVIAPLPISKSSILSHGHSTHRSAEGIQPSAQHTSKLDVSNKNTMLNTNADSNTQYNTESDALTSTSQASSTMSPPSSDLITTTNNFQSPNTPTSLVSMSESNKLNVTDTPNTDTIGRKTSSYGHYPFPHLLINLQRYCRFASAAYGKPSFLRKFIKTAGFFFFFFFRIVNFLNLPGVIRCRIP